MSSRSPGTPPPGLAVPDGVEAETVLEGVLDDDLRELIETAAEHRGRRVAGSTQRYHASDWAAYERWCELHGARPLPVIPVLVAAYVADLARQVRADGAPRFKVSSMRRHVASIAHRAYENGQGRGLGTHETISATLGGIERLRQEKADRKRPLLLDDVKRLIGSFEHHRWPHGVTAARDTLVVLLAFATGMRRDELVSLSTEQVTLQPLDGIWVSIGRSKTDQAGRGATLPVPFGRHTITCVPCAWVRWLRLLGASAGTDVSGRAARMRLVRQTPADPADWRHVCRGPVPDIDSGVALLRPVTKAGAIGDRAVTASGLNQALKRRLEAAGYDPAAYGMHSLRAGHVTQARRNGADARSVRMQTRHSSDAMVDVYDREWNPLEGNSVLKLGL